MDQRTEYIEYDEFMELLKGDSNLQTYTGQLSQNIKDIVQNAPYEGKEAELYPKLVSAATD